MLSRASTCSLLCVLLPLASWAQSPPVPAKVVEITLENPSRSDSKCYLDLDAGATFAREDNPLDFGQSERWMRENGIDIKCDTNFPIEGIGVYDLILLPTEETFDAFQDYEALKDRFKGKPEPLALDLKRLPAKLPVVYLFKTSAGAIGVMEIVQRMEAPNGVRLRYKLLPRPEVVVAGRRAGRGGRVNLAVPVPRGAAALANAPTPRPLAGTVTSREQQLVDAQRRSYDTLRQQLGADHPEVVAAGRRLELYEQLLTAQNTPIQTEALLAELNRRKREIEQNRARLEDQLRQIEADISTIQNNRRTQAGRGPTTMRVR
jgi:hypothetical protein